MFRERMERRLAAILANMAGYSRLMGVNEEGKLAQLKTYRSELVDPKISEYGERIVKTTGDGMLVEFAGVVEAMRCAVEVQKGMAERNALVPQTQRTEFRIGIHQGDIMSDAGDAFGDAVNVAARLEDFQFLAAVTDLFRYLLVGYSRTNWAVSGTSGLAR